MQTLSRRQFLRLGGFTVVGAALAACAAPTAPASAPAASSGGGEAAAPAAAPVELSISVVDYAPPTQELLDKELLPAYTDANVSVNYTAWNRYNEEMTTAFAGGVTPDVFQGGAVWAPQMAHRGWAAALDDYIAASGDWNWEDWFPALRDDVTIDGKVVGVPYRIDIRSFWYRKYHLGDAGITAPTNWEELRDAAIALTQRDGDKIVREGYHYSSPGGWQNDLQPYMFFMEMAGGQFLSDDLKSCTLDSDACIEAMTFIHQLVVEDQVQPYPGFEAQGDLGPLEGGLASMTISNESPERNARLYAPEELDNLVVTLPLKHKVQATHVWVNKWFISSQSKAPDAAWGLLAYLTNQANLEKYAASGNYTPPRASLGNASFMTDAMKTLLASTKYANPYPKYWRLLELFRPFATQLELCLSGKQSPEDTMLNTCKEIDAILAEDA